MVTGDPEDPTGLLDATVGPVLAPAGGVLATGGDPRGWRVAVRGEGGCDVAQPGRTLVM